MLSAALLASACGKDPQEDIDPLPPSTAESANVLMAEAENAAANAQARAIEGRSKTR